ncbi:MAG: carbohydrate ABC transporter substrate-binding protein [Clostridia bacterium]|nr:carbohydrate ABC transporter substrate-binding protein [Clostridia bacterium]
MFKRVLAILLCLVMVFALAACGGGADTGDGNDDGKFSESKLKMPEYKPTSDKVQYLSTTDPARWKDPVNWEYSFLSKLKQEYNISVDFIRTTDSELPTKAAQLVLSGNSPDLIQYRAKDDPTFIKNGIVQPVDELFSFEEPVFKQLKDVNELFRYKDGKLYTFIRNYRNDGWCYYWLEDLAEAGLETPRELYYKGEWTWSKFEEYAKKLTVKASDGSVERYGATYSNIIHAITGQTLVNYEGGVYTNNLRNPELADFFNRTSKLTFEDKVVEPTSSTQDSFKSHKVTICLSGRDMLDNRLHEEQKNGLVSFSPLPKWDNADQHYTKAGFGTTWIAKDAPNPQGAAAWFATYVLLIGNVDPDIQAQVRALSRATKGYSDEDYALIESMDDLSKFTLVQIRDEGLGVNWCSTQRSEFLNSIMRWNKSWAAQLETYYPLLNAAIEETK